MELEIVEGDILACQVEAIVNAWNRNVIPWWLLLPQGVSRAIKKRGGTGIFRELARFGSIPLGGARVTGAGSLPFRCIIHVAGINLLWFATEHSVRTSIASVMEIVNRGGIGSVAIPLIGSGSGNRGRAWSKRIILDELGRHSYAGSVKVVEYPGR